MKNKKSVMAFAAFQILIFHLWISIFPGNQIEKFLKETSYFGVDIFFFLSSFSIASRPVENYKSFVGKRFSSVYLKFILLAIFAFIYKKQKLKTLILNVLGVNLFLKGGGSFLWFAPAIMIMYILIPFLHKAYSKSWKITLVCSLGVWAVVGLIISNFTNYTQGFIFINRIPVILLGFYLAKSEFATKILANKKYSLIAGSILFMFGEMLIYGFAYKTKLMQPVTDLFYVLVIPASLGIILLISHVPENKVIKLIGGATLEMYGLQMIIGYKMANRFLSLNLNALIANLLTIICITLLSIIVSQIFDFMRRKLQR